MIRIILISILTLSILHANTLDIKVLQNEFQKNVIETNVFIKRYNTYLEKNCNDDFTCLKSSIEILKSWDTVKNDQPLQEFINQAEKITNIDESYWNKLLKKIEDKTSTFTKTQFISIVDLQKQYFILTIWDNETKKINYIGRDLISSGNINRELEIVFGEDHYLKTPTGVFESQIGWRSDGKISDDNVTQGYGKKDRFVFYFGKQDTVRYNTFDKNKNKIYNPEKWKLITDKMDFALHSHKSTKPMGQANSHGCIRMSDELNRFLDNNFVLHENMFKDNKWLHKYTKEPKAPRNYNFAGKYLIVLDKI